MANDRGTIAADKTKPGLLYLTYQYRIRPNATTEAALHAMMEEDRLLYNAALQERRDAHRFNQALAERPWACGDAKPTKINYQAQTLSLTKIRDDLKADGLPVGGVKRQRGALKRLDRAMQAFFRRVKEKKGKAGFPRFKSRDRWGTIEFGESGRVKDGRFYAPDLKTGIKIHWHRPLPPDMIRHLDSRIHRKADGWFVDLVITIPRPPATPLRRVGGIDLGLQSLLFTTEGDRVLPPKYYRQSEKELRRRQRALARAKRGSKGRERKKARVAKLHLRVSRQRKYFLNLTTDWLLSKYDVIVVERLQVANMVRNHHLSKSIADAGWGTLLTMLDYKAEKAGKKVVGVDPRNTSKLCASCDILVPKTLSVRVHRCPSCGLKIDRDWNAAFNIRQRAGSVLASLIGLGPEAFLSPPIDAKASPTLKNPLCG